MLLFGFVMGRWWAIPFGALVWTVLVLGAVPIGVGGLPLAAALGAANAAIGVIVRLGVGLAQRGALKISRVSRAT